MLGHVWIRALSIFKLGALLQGLSMSGISLHLGPRPTGTPIFTFGELPDGFTFQKILRVIAWSFTICGVFALLIPYRSRKLQMWMPIGVTVGFLLLIGAVAWANHSAWAHGLRLDAKLGYGILRPDQYRIPGVLQRIGVCYGVAATIALFGGRRLILASLIGLLTVYSVIMLAVPIRHHQTGELIPWHSPERLTKEDNVSRRVDEAVFDRWSLKPNGERDYKWKHTYSAYPDNEGLLSTIPAIGTSLLGILVGLWLRSDRTTMERAGGLLTAGVMLTILGYCLDAWLMPINKNLWTPSFVIFCGGMGMLGLGAMFWMIDVRGRRRWAWPLVVYGMNAIAAFVAANLLSKVQSLIHFQYNEKPVALGRYLTDHAADAVQVFSDRLQHLSPHFPKLATPQNTSLAYAVGFVAAVWVVMLILYVCRIFIKV
jgi:predicted acyltransferase